jgi:hypothetical protein
MSDDHAVNTLSAFGSNLFEILSPIVPIAAVCGGHGNIGSLGKSGLTALPRPFCLCLK